MSDKKSYTGIAAMILAAGEGRRIGMPKWQLMHEGKSFLEIIIDKLRISGIEEIYCVVRKESIPLLELKYIINPEPEQGMISSVFRAAKEIAGAVPCLIFPVDHPFVSSGTIRELCRHIEKSSSKIIRPVYRGRGGHPFIIPRELIPLIPQMYEGGMKQYFSDHKIGYFDVEVDDTNILKNVNYRKDLA